MFASATNSALPLPVIAALMTRTHATSLEALHTHPETAETDTLKGPPSGDTREEELLCSKRHGAAFCVTVTRLAVTTRSVDRSIAMGFSATSTLTDACPWPEFGRTCIHDASLSIVHRHSRFVEMVAVRRVADDGRDVGRPVNAV
jgi:hypothetical protein